MRYAFLFHQLKLEDFNVEVRLETSYPYHLEKHIVSLTLSKFVRICPTSPDPNHSILLELMYIYNSAWELVDVLEEVRKTKGVTVMIILEDESFGNHNEIAKRLECKGFHVVRAFNNDERTFLQGFFQGP